MMGEHQWQVYVKKQTYTNEVQLNAIKPSRIHVNSKKMHHLATLVAGQWTQYGSLALALESSSRDKNLVPQVLVTQL